MKSHKAAVCNCDMCLYKYSSWDHVNLTTVHPLGIQPAPILYARLRTLTRYIIWVFLVCGSWLNLFHADWGVNVVQTGRSTFTTDLLKCIYGVCILYACILCVWIYSTADLRSLPSALRFFPPMPAASPDFHFQKGWGQSPNSSTHTHIHTHISCALFPWEPDCVPDRNCIHWPPRCHPAGTQHLPLHPYRVRRCVSLGQDEMGVQPWCSWVMARGTGALDAWAQRLVF